MTPRWENERHVLETEVTSTVTGVCSMATYPHREMCRDTEAEEDRALAGGGASRSRAACRRHCPLELGVDRERTCALHARIVCVVGAPNYGVGMGAQPRREISAASAPRTLGVLVTGAITHM